MRQPSGSLPNTSIPAAITSFASCGCSALGSSPRGVPWYGEPTGGSIPAITLAALT